MRMIFFISVILLLQSSLFAQNQKLPDTDNKTDWWGDIDGFYNQQARITLDMVNDVLKIHRPEVSEPLIRKMALLMIDNVLHEEKAAYHSSVQEFFKKRIENAVEEISNEEVKEGALIWKLYNHAFVVKTSSLTIGFDIQKGVSKVEGFTLSNELMKKLTDVVDILFVTHFHGDHADAQVAEMFLAKNKPVITPAGIWSELPVYKKVLHIERKPHEIQEVFLPEKGFSLKIVTYPGHQGETIMNNVYLVFTPEGLSFSHTGDQSNNEDFAWIDRIGDFHSVDVVMVNSWAVDPGQRLAKGFRPGLIIAGHENEMGHTVDHREPYWLNSDRLGDNVSFPWIQMVWGEKYHYIPAKKIKYLAI